MTIINTLHRIGIPAVLRQATGYHSGQHKTVSIAGYTLGYPVPGNYTQAISQLFGANPQNYAPMKGHDGIDWAVPVGTMGLAAADGKITKLALSKTGYGRQLWMVDSQGNTLIYGHNHSWLCAVGDVVKRGQPIITTGGDLADPYRGYSTGPHLHFELRPAGVSSGNGYGGAVDPMPYITGQIMPDPIAIATGTVIANGLRVRNKPSITGAVLDYLMAGSEITIYSIGGDVWVKIDPQADRWVAARIGNADFITGVKAVPDG